MNLDLTLGNWRNQRISLLGWASLANTSAPEAWGIRQMVVAGIWNKAICC
jgi:hypothetical protein